MASHVNPALEPLLVDVAALQPDPCNARRHSARSISAIATSLEKYGQQKPIVALRDGTVIAGNGTLRAALDLGWSHVAAIYFNNTADGRAYALADNRAAELSDWNVDELLRQAEQLDAETLELIGFAQGDLQDYADIQANPFVTERLAITALKPHPRNYQQHPDNQLEHIMQSIRIHGFYRNIVVAKDNTILAGHGVVQAAEKLGKARVPVIRLPIEPNDPRALKVLTSDNEISNLAETNDRALTELLKEILQLDNLDGTGFDEAQLAAMAMVTRPASEFADFNAAAEWVGMPEYMPNEVPFKLVVSFRTEADRTKLLEQLGARTAQNSNGRTATLWWPEREREDLASLKFTQEDGR